MNPHKKLEYLSNRAQWRPRGFALVVTLSLLVLLALVVIGLLTLWTTSLRTSTNERAMAEARANARLALTMSIGELQKSTGQDTRITAPSTIIDQTYPPLTGVWRSWEGTDHESSGAGIGRPIAPAYNSKRQAESAGGRFVGWLVSSPSTNTTTAPAISDATSLVKTSPTTDGSTVPLLAGGSLQSSDLRQVHVVPTKLDTRGRFAWWISGENQKARLAQPYQPRLSNVAGTSEMGQSHTVTNPEAIGLASLLTELEPHYPDATATKPASKALSRQSMALIEAKNPAEPQKKFHDFSSSSIGLLTNSATGGWRKDLSLLTEKWDAIYASYPGGSLPLFRYAPAAASTSQVPKPAKPAAGVAATVGATTLTPASKAATPPQSNLYPWSDYSLITGNTTPATYHAASASWQSLVSFATAYKNFTTSSGDVQSPFVWDMIMSNVSSPTALQIYNYKHTQRLHPQIARFQFLVYAKAIESPVGFNPKRYQLSIMYVPIFTLWNPYNVGITYTIPSNATVEGVGFGWRRALPGVMAIVNKATYPTPASVPNNQYQLFTAGNVQYDDAGGNDFGTGYDWQLPENGAKGYTVRRVDIRTFMASLPPGQLTFKPGEAKVFSPDFIEPAQFGGVGLRLKEGYNPTSIIGYQSGVGSYNATQSLWFLMKTDKLTKPFKTRAVGQGFSLAFGKTTGPVYNPLGTAPLLQKGVADTYHNLTSLSSDSQASAYWPPTEVDEVGYSLPELASGPWIPIFSINFGPRMTIGTGPGAEQNRPTKGVLQSNPLASLALGDPATGAAKDHPGNGTFDITYHSLSLGSNLTPNLSTSAGYIATGYQSGDGLSRLIMCDIPLRPMASLVELQGWNPRGNNPYPPFQSNLIGNSDATPLIPMDKVVPPVLTPGTIATNLQHDDAYCANHLLFDDWFVSSIAPDPVSFGQSISRDINRVYEDFLRGVSRLPNRAYLPIYADCNLTSSDAATRAAEVIPSSSSNSAGWLKVASRLEVEGMFNVNSTSVDAWKALLGHAKSRQQLAMHGAGDIVSKDISKKHVVTRGAIAPDVEAGSAPAFGGQFANASEYTGFRSLSDSQIEDLAKKIVDQVRLRGPFLSLSEFVNRQLSTNENLALAGAVQTAINNMSVDPMATLRNPANALSDKTMAPTDPKMAGVSYQFVKAAEGSSAYGAPGWIRQADILRPIAPVLSVRDDTFTIRTYGDSRDKKGNVVARAWCEAVVKRTRDFSDKSEAADSIEPPTKAANMKFGRRYEIISFRWLDQNEV